MRYFGLSTLQHWSLYRYKEANYNKHWAITVARRLKKIND